MINLIKNRNNDLGIIKTLPLYVLFIGIIVSLFACNSKKVKYTPRGYLITEPQGVDLGTKLDEISGICWVNDTLMLANNDESGRIFAINLKNLNDKEYFNIKFGEKADYEDLVKVDSAIYLLVATGKIVKVTGYQDEATVQSEVVATLPGVENEFESLYYDSTVNSLIMLCKDCHKEKNRVRSAYRYDLAKKVLIDSPYFQVQMQEIFKILSDKGAEFRPSAASLNPVDGKLYMISAIGDLMVIAKRTGKVESAFHISPLHFPQPEGITFSSNGDMYISNEMATEPAATLLKFPYGKSVKQVKIE